MIDQNAICPVCGKSDKVEKVSGIVRNRTTVYSEYGTAHQVNNLPRELQPPEKPRTNIACLFLLGYSILLLIYPYVLSTLGEGASSMILTLLLLLGLVLGLVIFSVIAIIRQSQTKMPNWERAMDKWNQLYYCHRDDVIFNPQDAASRSMPVSNMTQYLYSAAPHPQQDE